jgi:1-acyl-sn-glycerol-3-phosphate acyltransferase
MVLEYLKYPLWTLWRFVANFPLAVRNTRITLVAFWRTVYIGSRAIRILRKNAERWSERTRGRYIWRVARRFWARWLVDYMGIRVTVEGGAGMDWSHPHIVVANHQSTLDILLLVSLLPSGRFVAKKEVLRYPVVGAAVRHGGQIVIDRADHAQAMAAIRQGLRAWPDSNLVFFAEGTRTRTGRLQPFKKGAFSIAREMALPILPVAISGTYDALPKGSLLRLGRRPPVRIAFGAEIPPDEDVIALTARTREVIGRMITEAAPRPVGPRAAALSLAAEHSH